jgi:hypothetical protein
MLVAIQRNRGAVWPHHAEVDHRHGLRPVCTSIKQSRDFDNVQRRRAHHLYDGFTESKRKLLSVSIYLYILLLHPACVCSSVDHLFLQFN